MKTALGCSLRRRQLLLASAGSLAAPLLGGCGGGGGMGMGTGMGGAMPGSSSASPAPPAGGSWRELPRLANRAASGFEATLTAAATTQRFAAGIDTPVLGYEGQSPGPLIELSEAEPVRITLANRLAEDSTVHWHGLAVPASEDGNPMDPVAPGASRSYRFTLPAGSAGSHWYHPHPHQRTAEQVYRGLAGPLIVRGGNDPLAALPERIAFVTDLRLDAAGRIPASTVFDETFGREGDWLLVNGVLQPADRVAPGRTERWRLFNATNARYLRLVLDGALMQLVALDGRWLAAPRAVSSLLLAPAQRADVVVRLPSSQAQRVMLRTLPYERAMGMATRPGQTLFELVTTDAPLAAPFALPVTLPAPAPIAAPARTQSVLLADMGMMGGMGMMAGGVTINGRSFDPARDDLVARAGVPEEWTVRNDGTMDHPLHVHGTAFQVVASSHPDAGADARLGAFGDTVNVRPGEALRLRVAFDAPGRLPLHCHILEHEDAGMMGIVRVDG